MKHNPDDRIKDKVVVLKVAKYKGYPILIRKVYDWFEYVVFISGQYYSDSMLVSPDGDTGYTKLQMANIADILFSGACLTINKVRGEDDGEEKEKPESSSNSPTIH